MSKIESGIGYFNKFILILAALVIKAYSYLYNRIIKRSLNKAIDKVIFPLVDTIDNEYYGVLVFLIFLIELLLLLIIPWFFSWKIGLIIITYLLLTIGILIAFLEKENIPNSKITFFIIWIIPYLLLALFPTAIITIARKKEKPKLTLIEIRRNKLKYLKKKIRKNKLKFWKKWVG
jgi:hypothetical protein